MRKNPSPLLVRVALVCAAVLLLFTIPGQAQPQSLLTRHVRDEVANGRAQFVGQLPATQTLRFDIVLPLRDRAGLQAFVHEVQDPASPSYHQFLAPQEFTARFGPSQEDWDALVAFAKASGFEVISGNLEERDLRLTGTVANIEKAFHVTMGTYRDLVEDRTFFAIDREPTVDLPFQLWHITGLDNDSRPHPLYVRKSDYAKAHGLDPNKVVSHATTGSGPSASFLGSDMRAAYYGGTALTGSGQNLALFEFLGTDLADLTTYYKNVGQTEPYTPTLISTGGYSTSCTESGGCDDTEQTLDMTQAMGMAPGSTMLYMYVCGNASNISDTDCISAMVSTTDAPLSKQISCSWGWTPADPSTLDPYFEQMASQGQNFFAASGDSSAWSSSNEAWPADDANIVSVGGTDLTTSSAAGPWKSETAWVDSGGGNSPDSIAIPSWQTPVDGCSGCSKTLRNGPDVSANANFTFYVCADQTTCTANEYGGTSFAAPMWAGYLALANQQAASNGESIGFINPIIYPAAEGSSYGTDFHHQRKLRQVFGGNRLRSVHGVGQSEYDRHHQPVGWVCDPELHAVGFAEQLDHHAGQQRHQHHHGARRERIHRQRNAGGIRPAQRRNRNVRHQPNHRNQRADVNRQRNGHNRNRHGYDHRNFRQSERHHNPSAYGEFVGDARLQR